MNANLILTLANIQAQVKNLLGVDVKVQVEDWDFDSTFGTAIVFQTEGYSPEITRYYWDEIEEVDEQELISAYAITFNSIPTKFLSSNGEETTYTFLPQSEGVFSLNSDTWYKQPESRKRVLVETDGEFDLVSVSRASSWFFKPNSNVKVKVSKELVWGCQTDDDWNFYSSWQKDEEIDQEYSEWNDTVHHYAKQQEIWKAEITT